MNKQAIKKLNAGGGIVFRYQNKNENPEILLIFRNGVWDLPKGKTEKGEVIEMSAVREVAEEVGSSLPAIVSFIGTTYHEYEENGEQIAKTTQWYSMIFTKKEHLNPQHEEGIERVAWVPFDEAINKVGFQNLKDILKTYKK